MNTRIFCLIILALSLVGCKREDPNPENLDRIYIDLIKELRAVEAIKGETEKAIETAIKDLAKSQPRTMERKNAQNDLQRAKDKLVQIDQMLEFYKIRSERRRVEGRRAYKIAFSKGEPWPNPKEYEDYLQNKKLVHAPRNWDTRVPRSGQYIDPSKTKPAAEEGGGGGH